MTTQSTPHARPTPRRWSPVRATLLLAGVALVGAFIARVGVADIATQLERAGAKTLWLFVPYAIGTALGAFPWGALLPRGVRPSVAALIQSRFAASSANSLLPFFGMAGEPSRLLWLPAGTRARGLAAIAIDRLLYNAANGVVLTLGAIVAALATSLSRSLVWLALAIGVLTIAATPLGFFLLARLGVGEKAHLVVRRFFGRRKDEPALGRSVDRALLESLRGSVRPFWSGAATHLLSRLVVACEIPVGLWALGADYDLPRALVLAVVPIALSVVFSSVPAQIGVQEGAQTLVGSTLGLSPAVVLSLVLLQRFRQLVFAALLPFLLSLARARFPRAIE